MPSCLQSSGHWRWQKIREGLIPMSDSWVPVMSLCNGSTWLCPWLEFNRPFAKFIWPFAHSSCECIKASLFFWKKERKRNKGGKQEKEATRFNDMKVKNTISRLHAGQRQDYYDTRQWLPTHNGTLAWQGQRIKKRTGHYVQGLAD